MKKVQRDLHTSSIITIYIYIYWYSYRCSSTVGQPQCVCVCVYACIGFGSFPFNSAPFQHYDCWFDVAVAFFNIPYQYIHCNCCSPNEPTGSTHTKIANHRTKWMRMDKKLHKQSKWSICVQSTDLSVKIPILIKISNFFFSSFSFQCRNYGLWCNVYGLRCGCSLTVTIGDNRCTNLDDRNDKNVQIEFCLQPNHLLPTL